LFLYKTPIEKECNHFCNCTRIVIIYTARANQSDSSIAIRGLLREALAACALSTNANGAVVKVHKSFWRDSKKTTALWLQPFF